MESSAPAPARTVVIRPSGLVAPLELDDLWRHRDLLYFLTWRDVRVRYKQTLLGVLWIVLQPLINLAVFSVLFGQLLAVPSAGAPYPLFAFAALLPWNFFAASLNRAAMSLVLNARLVTKVYFPRLILPLAGVLTGVVDAAVSLVLLVVLMGHYAVRPGPGLLLVPVLLLLAMIAAVAFGVWLAALNVRFRDVSYVVPFLIQLWMYVTPVIYGSMLVPERLRGFLALNPMTGVVEGVRWALLGAGPGGPAFPGRALLAGALVTALVLAAGVLFFRKTERTFADHV